MHDTGNGDHRNKSERINELLQTRMMDLESYIDIRKTHWAELNAELEHTRSQLAARETALASKTAQTAELGSRVLDLERNLAQLRDRLEEREVSYERLDAAMSRERFKRDKTIAKLEDEMQQMRDVNQALTRDCAKASKRVRKLEHSVEERSARIRVLRNELRESKQEISRLRDASDTPETSGIRAVFHMERSELEHENELLTAEKTRLINKTRAQRKLIEQLEIELESKRQPPDESGRRLKQLTLLGQSLQRMNTRPGIDTDNLERRHRQLRKRHKFISLDENNTTDFMLSKQCVTIGRSSRADIRIQDTAISRHHARLIEHDEGIMIEDIASKNGLLVNDKAARSIILRDGDIVTLGKRCRFRFVEEVTPVD